MTETRFTWRWLLVIAVVGIFMGLAVGLAAGWILFPNIGGSGVAGLSASSQNDYIVLVANTYAYDQDLKHAQDRLAQLQDKDIKTRVERLAKSYATRQDQAAANLADLALALGSDDSSLQVLAEQVTNTNDNGGNSSQDPPKVAQDATEEATATDQPTAKPTKVKKQTATSTEQAEPTNTPKPKAPAVKPTAKPTDVPPTAAPAAASITAQIIPDYPSLWWPDIHFQPAQGVAAGQSYWRLKYALFCDVDDQRNNCPGLPGGGMDHSIYVQVLNPDGSCSDAKVGHLTNTGDTKALESKDVAYPWNDSPCRTDYEWNMFGEGNDVWVDDGPSDKVTGMCLCNVIPPPGTTGILQGHAHVRYFLIFQKTTR